MMIMKRVAVLAGILASAFVNGQEVFGNEKSAYLLLPAEVISSGIVSLAEFSHSGRYITYRRLEISTFETEILGKESQRNYTWFRYDRTTKTNQRLAVPPSTTEVRTLGDNQTVYFTGDKSEDHQGFLNVKTGLIVRTNFALESITYAGELESAPYFVVKLDDRTISIIHPSGNSVSVSMPTNLVVMQPVSSNANSITFVAMQQSTPRKFGHLVYQKNKPMATFAEVPSATINQEMYPQVISRLFWSESIGELLYVHFANTLRPVDTDIPAKAKLTTARSTSSFGPRNDCVIYEVAGALLIRDIKPIDLALARTLTLQAAMQKAISDSKEAVLSLIMFASDSDDVLPGQEGWEARVGPYCSDKDLLRRFNYTFKGGNMANIENPASAELGYILGPGGRAVAYGDGHVKWVPNP